MHRLLSFLRPVAIILAAALVAFVMLRGKPEIAPRDVEVPRPVVNVQRVTLATIPVTVVAYGNVTAWRKLDLTAQVTGRVLEQAPEFEPGEIVDAGYTLLRVDPTDYELALAEARQSLASAQLALADAQALRQAARVVEAQATVAAAEARIARAERDLANTRISAPYRAVVDEQLVEEGQYISVGTRVGRVLGADRAEVRLSIPPQDIGFIDVAAGASVTLTTSDASSNARWSARLTRIEARIDADTRIFPVVVEVEDPLNTGRHDVPLRFGQFVRAEVFGGTVANAVVIPQAALHDDDDVFLLEDGQLARRSVTVGRISEGGALVTDGLATGDRVVTTRLDLMFEGMAVALNDGA